MECRIPDGSILLKLQQQISRLPGMVAALLNLWNIVDKSQTDAAPTVLHPEILTSSSIGHSVILDPWSAELARPWPCCIEP
nr:hypothetical protein CFP56_13403 [Quercus suber]